MSVLSEIKHDEFLVAGFVIRDDGSYHGLFDGLDVGVTVSETVFEGKYAVILHWRDVKYNQRGHHVTCSRENLFEEARRVILEESDNMLDICRLKS